MRVSWSTLRNCERTARFCYEREQARDTSPTRKAPTLIHAQSLYGKHFEPVKYIIAGLFPEGVTLLASRPKLGKSWLLLQTGTNGTVTLASDGCHLPSRRRSLPCTLEDSERRPQRRLTKYFGEQWECWPARLALAASWRWEICGRCPGVGAGRGVLKLGR
jgi:AAA domain